MIRFQATVSSVPLVDSEGPVSAVVDSSRAEGPVSAVVDSSRAEGPVSAVYKQHCIALLMNDFRKVGSILLYCLLRLYRRPATEEYLLCHTGVSPAARTADQKV